MEEKLPVGWVKNISKSTGKPYYFHEATKESRWEAPSGTVEMKKEQVKASHILAKHRDSRRPSSWREENITRTKEEALAIIQGFRKQILNNEATFGEIAQENSDCSSAKRDGDLGLFGRGQMQKPFEDVTFGMERRRSKKIGGDLNAPTSLANSRPTSGISVVRGRKVNTNDPGELPTVSIDIPVGHRMNSGGNKIGITGGILSDRPESPVPEDAIPVLKPSAIITKVRNQPKREDFVLKMMEDGTVDGILNIVSQMAKMYQKSLPPNKVLDELAKSINEEQGTQQDFKVKVAVLEAETIALEKTVTQLQLDHDELKAMDEARAKSSTEKSVDQPDAKQALEEKLKKAKALKTEKTKKKLYAL
ncbi:putative Peptidyl-prolyl cis-trans isomerase NIMA-interacting 1 [Hypsibius exemplaris]|uniref:peptidylprolyl isomerase n=1 Tax=Hypsibius exemplaris TaxID=2072580 RepID=A0A1W0XEX1_HYPEX|nr:putative Peptidyl-prolyl cis-trans isomerase NIMA-interacting 1 [Hypsibius exemplaris]